MKMSELFVQTLREVPQDAEVASHRLLVKAGFVKKLTSGVYIYLPLMLRVLQKIEKIVREEMNASGAQELLMPFLQPSELWMESGRWNAYGKELMRFKDRHEREVCLGPTHEEIITFIAREIIKSYKQLPVNLYQIQSKFRDEIRPRFGLLRGREFIMKDAYSFHTSESDLDREYEVMAKTYSKIFKRCSLQTKMIQSDSGAIGGSVAHEFTVILDNNEDKSTQNAGENDVFFCEKCSYQANSNHAKSFLDETPTNCLENVSCEVVETVGKKTIEEVANFLKVDKSAILKTVVYVVDTEIVFALIRADKQVEETKLKNFFNGTQIRPARPDEIEEFMKKQGFDVQTGYISTFGFNKDVKMVCDIYAKNMKNFVIGANQNNKHIVGANFGSEIKDVPFADIHLVEQGEPCPYCQSPLKVAKGIEVGNIFKLGTKYSESMKAYYTDKDGKNKPFIMGCYGIGISRTAQSAVEVHHDKFGIKWPVSIAPFEVVIVPVNILDEKQMQIANRLYSELENAKIETVLDDRDERAGVKFKDADLIGFPLRINVGKTVSEGLVELKIRATDEMFKLGVDEVVEKVKEYVEQNS